MIFDKNGNTIVITKEKVSIVELVKKLAIIYSRYENDNIIINLTTIAKISTSDVIEFLQLSNRHRGANHSFVIVTNRIEIDDSPDELVIVPTLQEAYDIIEMEEIERDLGF